MPTDYPSVGLNDGLFEAYRRMTEAGLGAVPVIDKGFLLGLFTRRDANEVYQLLSVSPELLMQRRDS